MSMLLYAFGIFSNAKTNSIIKTILKKKITTLK